MAATTRAASTEPLPPLNASPRTPIPLAKPPVSRASANTSSPKLAQPALSPVALTGVAAAAENRKRQREMEQAARDTSPNPAVQAVQSLMGGGGMSRPSDAPDPTKISEPLQTAAEKMHIPDGAQQGRNSVHASPVSLSSFGTNESAGAPNSLTATASDGPSTGHQFVAEPAQMTDGPTYHSSNGNLDVSPTDQEGPKAFSYPGPPPQDPIREGGPTRGMSLPGYGQGSPKSPASNKRHKCPYCSTDFTRHHNLKSHLLTHSQEKPYVCQTCQARFRRLHDLKRHTKLHTGERPHTCDKCGRRFARGDALARHNKGPGGCAGRRASFGGDDDGFGPDGDVMDGVEYDEEDSSPDHGRRVSEPSRKRTHLETPEDPRRQIYRQGSSTYPPPYQPPSRPHAGSQGNMGPPQVMLPGQSQTGSPREMNHPTINAPYYSNAGQVIGGGIIESPKPLVDGHTAPDQQRLSVGDASMSGMRNRSPSLSTQFQHFGRGSDPRTPPAGSHAAQQYASQPPPPPPSSSSASIPMLPPLTNQPPPGRSSSFLHHQPPTISGPGPTSAGSGPHSGSNPGSLSSHGRSSGSSIRDIMSGGGGGSTGGGGQEQADLWAYVRQLEGRFSRMQDEYELRISRLQEEVITLKGQLSSTGGGAAAGGGGGGGGAGYSGAEMGSGRY